MVHVLAFLIVAINSNTHENCEKIPFCRKNFEHSTNYYVLCNTYIFNITHLTIYLQDKNKLNNITLTISSPKDIGIHIKTGASNTSNVFENNIFKYDLSSESCIINQTIFQNFRKFELQYSPEDYFQLSTSNIEILIHINPFTIDILKSSHVIATLNKKQLFISEYTEVIKDYDDTKTNSGIDISLDSKRTYFFSGLGGISQTFNIDENIYRLYNTGSYPMHSSVPFIIAHSNYKSPVGFFWANPSDTFIQCINNSIRFLSETGFVDLYVFLGSYSDIQEQYSLLTGKPFFPPIFSLGYHQCRSFYKTQNEVYSVMANMKKAKLSFDSIWLDINHLPFHASFGYNETTFSEPKKLIGLILTDDRYLIRVSNPYLPVNVNHKQFTEANLRHYLVNQSDKVTPYISQSTAFPDFLNPDVRSWWANQYNYDVDISSTNVFYWNDKDDGSFPKDSIHFNGFQNRDIHNIYGLLMSAATSQGLINRNLQNKENSHLRPYLVSLNVFSGSQKYAWSWTGDNSATWEDLERSLAQVVSSGVSGIPFTGSNVGGFKGHPSDELIVRWFQLASWTYPFFRQQSLAKIEPYLYRNELFEGISNAITTRYKHLLVWYNAAHISNLTGNPIVKPLWLFLESSTNFPSAHNITDQVIVADVFMIAPILTQNQTIRNVIKPPGRWYCYPGGYELQESTNFLVTLMDTPVFLAGGKIILVYQEIGPTTIETIQEPNLDMYISLDENDEACGEVYIDDGVSFNYNNGSFFKVIIQLKNGKLKINCQGNFGMGDEDDGSFIKKIQIKNIYVFGLKKKPKNIRNFVTHFNGDRFLINIPSDSPLYLQNKTNMRIIAMSINPMTLATIIVGVLLCVGIITISIIVPIFLLRREKMKEISEAPKDESTDIKNPILENESI